MFACRCCDSGRGAGTSRRAPAHPGGQLAPLSVADPDPGHFRIRSKMSRSRNTAKYAVLYSPPVEGTVNSLEQKTRVSDVKEFRLCSRCSRSLAGRSFRAMLL